MGRGSLARMMNWSVPQFPAFGDINSKSIKSSLSWQIGISQSWLTCKIFQKNFLAYKNCYNIHIYWNDCIFQFRIFHSCIYLYRAMLTSIHHCIRIFRVGKFKFWPIRHISTCCLIWKKYEYKKYWRDEKETSWIKDGGWLSNLISLKFFFPSTSLKLILKVENLFSKVFLQAFD